ncbi:MAG: hypothetical protein H6734_18615 [Alphaproteobacteria bacterium]|nr:hypothetical protein [Alphaproteobacteria bacterium]
MAARTHIPRDIGLLGACTGLTCSAPFFALVATEVPRDTRVELALFTVFAMGVLAFLGALTGSAAGFLMERAHTRTEGRVPGVLTLLLGGPVGLVVGGLTGALGVVITRLLPIQESGAPFHIACSLGAVTAGTVLLLAWPPYLLVGRTGRPAWPVAIVSGLLLGPLAGLVALFTVVIAWVPRT